MPKIGVFATPFDALARSLKMADKNIMTTTTTTETKGKTYSIQKKDTRKEFKINAKFEDVGLTED